MEVKIILEILLQQKLANIFHLPRGFPMSTVSPFRSIENNNNNVYRGKGCIKRFCEFLREHAMKIIDFKKKK